MLFIAALQKPSFRVTLTHVTLSLPIEAKIQFQSQEVIFESEVSHARPKT